MTQTHALHYVDINGDGQKDLVTGKRWWAHGPGGDDNPSAIPVIIWFEIRRKEKTSPEFIPHVIGESAGSGIGTQFAVTDFDGDKIPDIPVEQKGTNVLLQRRKVIAIPAAQPHRYAPPIWSALHRRAISAAVVNGPTLRRTVPPD